MTKSKLGRKGFIWLIFPHYSLSPKEIRTGTQTGKESGGRSYTEHYPSPPSTIAHVCHPGCFSLAPAPSEQPEAREALEEHKHNLPPDVPARRLWYRAIRKRLWYRAIRKRLCIGPSGGEGSPDVGRPRSRGLRARTALPEIGLYSSKPLQDRDDCRSQRQTDGLGQGSNLQTFREDIISKIHFRIIINLPNKQTKQQKYKNKKTSSGQVRWVIRERRLLWKPGNLSCIPRTHKKMEKENQFHQIVP